MTESLRLVPAARPGTVDAAGRRAARSYLDFEVDGERLGPLLSSDVRAVDEANDYASVIVTNWPGGFPLDDVLRLLGETPADLADGRIPLYVCAECGGPGCGAITATIEFTDTAVTWHDFGWQTDYDDFVDREAFASVGPFNFERGQYERVLRDAIADHASGD